MTINIALATSDSLVLGCDSVASAREFYLDPFQMQWERDSDGQIVKDADGKYSLKFDYGDLTGIVTNAWGGVKKMFEIHKPPAPMVAVMAGTAKLSERPVASYAEDFLEQYKDTSLTKGDEIAEAFLKFMRAAYDKHYKESTLPEAIREGPEFLIGGYGQYDAFPSIYRVRTQENDCVKEFGLGTPNGTTGGVSWNGQSDAVERFMRGYDTLLRIDIEKRIQEDLGRVSENALKAITSTVNDALTKLGVVLPEGTKFDLPDLKASSIDWNQYAVGIDYANLPLQEAINFVGFLVMLQAGKARFARGVATVGGYVHVGVVTKNEGFKALEEPKLVHKLRGFTDDL